jgi:hypothetical protein
VEKAIEYVLMLRILATGVVDFAFDFVEGEEECVESSVRGLFVRIVKGGIVAQVLRLTSPAVFSISATIVISLITNPFKSCAWLFKSSKVLSQPSALPFIAL